MVSIPRGSHLRGLASDPVWGDWAGFAEGAPREDSATPNISFVI